MMKLGVRLMSEYLPNAVRDELARAEETRNRKKPRRTVKVGGESFTILRSWENGFSVDAAEAPKMRGLVDVYEGQNHVARSAWSLQRPKLAARCTTNTSARPRRMMDRRWTMNGRLPSSVGC